MSRSLVRLLPRGWAWLLVLGTLATVLAASVHALQPPTPLDRNAPAERFSEGRARDIVRHLTEDIGQRVSGAPGHAKAADYLAAELRKLPGVEVELQEVADVHTHQRFPQLPFVYRTTNVLGRLPGQSTDAILLDAHFDTLIDSVGAADDAVGVAAILEALRVLAAEAPLDRTILVNLNGAEEIGLLGAAGFLKHPFAKDVRAYVYLEALPTGRAALIGAGPGNPWLAKTYARTVSRPLGNVMAQELTQSGLLPFSGDFVPFHEAGLFGLDVAMVGDAWGVHTHLDRLDRLQPGGPQSMGDATLAVTRALASQATPLSPSAEPAVYYDLLGCTMLAYPTSVARVLGVLALVFFVFLLARARYFYWVTLKGVLAACALELPVGGGGRARGPRAGRGLEAGLPPLARLVRQPEPAAPVLRPARGGRHALRSPSLARACAAQAGGRREPHGADHLDGLPSVLGLLVAAGHHRWGRHGLRSPLLGGGGHRRPAARRRLSACPPRGHAARAGAWCRRDHRARDADRRQHRPHGGTRCRRRRPPIWSSRSWWGFRPAWSWSLPPPCPIARAGSAGPPRCVPCWAWWGSSSRRSPHPTRPAGPSGWSPCTPPTASKARCCSPASAPTAYARCSRSWPTPRSRPPRGSSVARSSPLSRTFCPRPRLPCPCRAPRPWRATTTPRPTGGGSPCTSTAAARSRLLQFPARALLGWSLGEKLPAEPPVEGKYQVNLEGVPEAGVDIELVLRGWQPVEIDLRGIAPAPADAAEVRALAKRLPDWVNLTAQASRLVHVKI